MGLPNFMKIMINFSMPNFNELSNTDLLMYSEQINTDFNSSIIIYFVLL